MTCSSKSELLGRWLWFFIRYRSSIDCTHSDVEISWSTLMYYSAPFKQKSGKMCMGEEKKKGDGWFF